MQKFTPEEERIIVHKGTETPFSGKYDNFFEPGTYACKRCGTLLYSSESKFDASCGWPSFDDAMPGAVKRSADPDGIRTEIGCVKCGAHLGHIFENERLTSQNIRHCVNSLSLNFIPQQNSTMFPKAYFAGGCFWGVEHLMKQKEGVVATRVGYMGGHKESPTYEEVCTGKTGHRETVEVSFNPKVISFENLAKFFFEIHDPTQVDRQGPDVGTQYQSVIFYTDEAQDEIAQKLINVLNEKGYPVETKLENATTFWSAEDYHQNYYSKTGKAPYCHFYTKRF